MNGAEILTKFTADTSDVDKKTNNFTASLGKLTKAFTMGQLAAKAISKAISIFNASLDDAIKRTDTLNNFPKVMSNLGIGAEEAEKSINELSTKLEGLPTTLDSAAMAVQRFTSGNGDIDKSTKYFLAVNNAILAGGASADIQASALEQLSQAYAKGKPDMMEWRTLLTAMPAQLKQVATAMGYVNATELGNALREGDVSMDKFMETIEKLNTQGLEGFASFEEQAKNSTGGIQTSIKNMKTAFVRGVADMIQAADEMLVDFGGISGVIKTLGKVGETIFKKLGKVLQTFGKPLLNIIQEFAPRVEMLFNFLQPMIDEMLATLVPLLENIINSLLPPILNVLMVLISLATQLIAQIMPPLTNLINMILPVLVKLINTLVPLLDMAFDILSPLIDALFEIITPITEILVELLPPLIDLIMGMIDFLMPMIMFSVTNTIEGIKDRVKLVTDFFKNQIAAFKKIFNGIIDFLTGVFTGDWKLAWNGISNIFGGIFDGMKNTARTCINFIIDNINRLIKGINNIKIPDWDIFGKYAGSNMNIPTIPRLATGTNFVPEDTLAMIHKGEAVIPKKFNPYANGINTNTLGAMGGTNNIIVNITNEMEFDALGQLVNNVKTFSGGAKNDYNYGMGG